GDVNAYRREDPVVALVNAGFTDIITSYNNSFPCNGTYSFVFDGQWGALDRAFASLATLADVTGVADWHVNSDEPDVWDYSTQFNDASYYENNVYRFSDHDPLIIGLDLKTNFTGVRVAPKVNLQGPWTGTSMSTNLATGLLPSTEPYTALGYSFLGGGGEQVAPTVLAQTGNDSIVDWVIVELRANTSPNTVLASRAALLQKDGDVVDVDGNSAVGMSGTTSINSGMYHVAIKHRNHLGTMTALPVMLNQ
ncbi:MAG: hypothetical protein AAF738_08495, partial [Bacteroidota bacterium]